MVTTGNTTTGAVITVTTGAIDTIDSFLHSISNHVLFLIMRFFIITTCNSRIKSFFSLQ
jgi:hypothetical protein